MKKKVNLHWAKKDLFLEEIPCFKLNSYKDLLDCFIPERIIDEEDRVYVVSYELDNKQITSKHQEVFVSANPFNIKAYLKHIHLIIGNLEISDIFIFEYFSYEEAYSYALDLKSQMCHIAYEA